MVTLATCTARKACSNEGTSSSIAEVERGLRSALPQTNVVKVRYCPGSRTCLGMMVRRKKLSERSSEKLRRALSPTGSGCSVARVKEYRRSVSDANLELLALSWKDE